MGLVDILNKKSQDSGRNNLYYQPSQHNIERNIYFQQQQQPTTNKIKEGIEEAKPVETETKETADIKATIKDKKAKFDLADYGETKRELIENIIKLKPNHNNCRKVIEKYCELIMEEDLFEF